MPRIVPSVCLLLLLAASAGTGAPMKGPYALPGVRVGARASLEFKERFQGGRRACVIAMGDHKPPVDLAIAIYDESDRLVVEQQGLDYATAIWYPPREAFYKVVVRNGGIEYNDMYVVFK